MSIIYNTITRLESENPLSGTGSASAGLPRLTGEGRSFPSRVLLILLIVVMGGGAVLWQHGEIRKEMELATPAAPAKLIEVEEKQARSKLSFVEVKAKFIPPVEMPVPDVDNSMQAAVPVVRERREDLGQLPADPPLVRVAIEAPVEEVDEVDEAIERARLSLSRGQYHQAIMALDHLVEDAPKRAEYWFLKGSAHLGLGQLEQADMAFATSQALAPDNVQIAIQQAIVKQEQGDHGAALQILQAALIEHSDVPEIYLNQGYSQLALGAQLEARRSFRAFLRMTEDRSLYVHNRSAVKQWLQQSGAI